MLTASERRMKDLTLIILATSEVKRLNILQADWEYVANVTAIEAESDIQEELSQIKEFFGNQVTSPAHAGEEKDYV